MLLFYTTTNEHQMRFHLQAAKQTALRSSLGLVIFKTPSTPAKTRRRSVSKPSRLATSPSSRDCFPCENDCSTAPLRTSLPMAMHHGHHNQIDGSSAAAQCKIPLDGSARHGSWIQDISGPLASLAGLPRLVQPPRRQHAETVIGSFHAASDLSRLRIRSTQATGQRSGSRALYIS